MRQTIDPSAVPPFPIYTLHLDEDARQLTLDGVPLEPSFGQEPHAAGIEAVIRKATSQTLEAVRVRVHSNTGDVWDMIVTAEGEVIDTTKPADDTEKRPTRWRKAVLPIILTVGILGIAGGIVAVRGLISDDELDVWKTPGVEAQIPVALPSEYSSHASWSIPVDKDSDVTALESGHILSTNPSGELVARDPDTAQPAWRSNDVPRDLGTLVQTQWQSHEVLAAYSGRHLYVWNLQLPEGQQRAHAHTIEIDHQWRVDVNGQSPMIDMGDWVVGVPGENYSLNRLVIPAGTRPLTATSSGGVITVSQDSFVTVDPAGEVAATVKYDTEDDIHTVPDQLWMVDEDHVLLGWDAKHPTLSVYRLSDGERLATTTVKHLPRQASVPILDEASQSAAVGDVALSWGNDPAIQQVEGIEISAVHDGMAYGKGQSSGPVRLAIGSEEAPEPWNTYSPDDPAPDFITEDAAYVIAPQLDETILYQAPVTTRNEDTQ